MPLGETDPVTIHSSHPFATPEPDRDPIRRLRGRMPAPVSVWAAGQGAGRTGWTLSSFLLVDGEPAEVVGVLDEDSALAERLVSAEPVAGAVSISPGTPPGVVFTVSLLGWQHRGLADAFAGVAPAPGGPFTLGHWRDTDWGPVLDDTPGWLGVRLQSVPEHAGWSLLVRATVDHVELGEDPADGMLGYVRGRYRAVGLDPGRSR
jgi:flavin reductase (DIM6/NTAB) family NADH-FMN oxidoreductase RutF